jgi:glutathione synthase
VKLLFIIDPPGSLKAYKDTTVAMMRAAQARGHEIHYCEQEDLSSNGRVTASAARLALADNDEDWYRAHGKERAGLDSFDAVLMRKDPPFDMEYLTSVWLLSQAEREGARVFNNPAAVRDHNEKLAILEFPQFIAPTIATRDPAQVHAFIDEHNDTILKRLDGMGGESIFRVRADDPNRNVIVETMTAQGARSCMAQRYLPAIKDGDKRILLTALPGAHGEAGRDARQPRRRRPRRGAAALEARRRDRRATRAGARGARPAAGGPGRDRRLRHRDQCHQPHLLSRDPGPDRI